MNSTPSMSGSVRFTTTASAGVSPEYESPARPSCFNHLVAGGNQNAFHALANSHVAIYQEDALCVDLLSSLTEPTRDTRAPLV